MYGTLRKVYSRTQSSIFGTTGRDSTRRTSPRRMPGDVNPLARIRLASSPRAPVTTPAKLKWEQYRSEMDRPRFTDVINMNTAEERKSPVVSTTSTSSDISHAGLRRDLWSFD